MLQASKCEKEIENETIDEAMFVVDALLNKGYNNTTNSFLGELLPLVLCSGPACTNQIQFNTREYYFSS